MLDLAGPHHQHPYFLSRGSVHPLLCSSTAHNAARHVRGATQLWARADKWHNEFGERVVSTTLMKFCLGRNHVFVVWRQRPRRRHGARAVYAAKQRRGGGDPHWAIPVLVPLSQHCTLEWAKVGLDLGGLRGCVLDSVWLHVSFLPHTMSSLAWICIPSQLVALYLEGTPAVVSDEFQEMQAASLYPPAYPILGEPSKYRVI
jgi:hypothetical protein